jgi:hypothetical protein
MDRGSSKHSPRVDEQMSQEVRGTVQGVAGARAEEWKMAEPSGEDQPQASLVPDEQGADFSRFGSYLGLSAFPGDRDALAKSAQDLEAPDDVLEALRTLPPGTTFQNAAEAWHALGR